LIVLPEIAPGAVKRVSTVSTEYEPSLTVRPEPPLASTRANAPIHACVFFVTTGTATAAPTPALPPAAIAPATTSSFRVSSAATRTLPSAAIDAASPAPVPSATYACVVTS
jgi:hypothetical protein